MGPHPFPHGPGPYDGAPWWPLAHAAADALTLLLLLGLVGLVGWGVVHWARRRQPLADVPAAPSAVELLRRRFARGEIDAATFEAMLGRIMASEAWEQSGWQSGGASGAPTGPLWSEADDPTERLRPDVPATGSD